MSTKRTLHRRSFLKGVGGATVALPLLEAMVPKAHAATGDTRYVLMHGGISMGVDTAPTQFGPGYDTPVAMQPLRDRGLLDDVSVVSNLTVPWGPEASMPAGGTSDRRDHGSCYSAVLSGTSFKPQPGGWRRMCRCEGPTSDVLVSNMVGSANRFRSLELKIQAQGYGVGASAAGNISWRSPDQPQPPTSNPQLAFDTLFSNLDVSTGEPAADRARRIALAQGKSVLDLVAARTERLLGRLGRQDQRRIEQHFTHIREIERQLADIPQTEEEAAAMCMIPQSPSVDPLGANVDGAWSGETQRGRVMCDMLAMALACDLTRVATVLISEASCTLSAEQVTGHSVNFHNLTHGGHTSGKAERLMGVAWHVDHFAYLCERLKSIPDGNGTLLDSSAIVFATEHGWGFDPSTQGENRAHSPTNFVMLVGGHAGGLSGGKHIDGAERHPAQTIVSAMEAVGAPGALGAIGNNIPELFT